MQGLNILVISLVLFGCGLPFFAEAQAEDAEANPATFTFQYSGLRWTTNTTKSTDQNGEETEQKSTSLLTADLVNSMVYMTIDGKLKLYFYPFQDGNALVSAGYKVRDDLEVGLDLGINSTRIDQPKSTSQASLFGGFATWSVAFPTFVLENGIVLDSSSFKTLNTNGITGEEETSEFSGAFLKVGFTAVVPIAKNAAYFTGAWFAMDHSKNKAVDAKLSSSQFGITLAGLRITLN
jgi:hypothetical protein